LIRNGCDRGAAEDEAERVAVVVQWRLRDPDLGRNAVLHQGFSSPKGESHMQQSMDNDCHASLDHPRVDKRKRQ